MKCLITGVSGTGKSAVARALADAGYGTTFIKIEAATELAGANHGVR